MLADFGRGVVWVLFVLDVDVQAAVCTSHRNVHTTLQQPIYALRIWLLQIRTEFPDIFKYSARDNLCAFRATTVMNNENELKTL